MAVSEKGYADRFQRGQLLQTAVSGFIPAFAPADADLLPAAFATYLGTPTV